MRILVHTRFGVWSIGRRGIERVHNLDWKKASEAFEVLFNAQKIRINAALEKQHDEFKKAAWTAETQGAWKALDDNTLPGTNEHI
jgi:hypothetical protein